MNEKYNIEAIETKYNSYHFRSRLEARWAVFFDAIGLEYVYEYQDFVLPNKGRYLPDFYFPTFDCYAEVKPYLHSDYIDLCVEFVNTTDKCIMLLDGVPQDKEYRHFGFLESDSVGYHNEYDKLDNLSFMDMRNYNSIVIKETLNPLSMSLWFFNTSNKEFPFLANLVYCSSLLYDNSIQKDIDCIRCLIDSHIYSNIGKEIEKSLTYKFNNDYE